MLKKKHVCMRGMRYKQQEKVPWALPLLESYSPPGISNAVIRLRVCYKAHNV